MEFESPKIRNRSEWRKGDLNVVKPAPVHTNSSRINWRRGIEMCCNAYYCLIY